MQVSVIGLGSMGRAFARRALATGHGVTTWNRSPGRASELVEQGAREADSPAEAAAGSDVALVVLADDNAVLDICGGSSGLAATLGPTTVLVNVSTVSPDTSRQLADICPTDRFLDAPVMGAPQNVADGHARFLVGGPLATVAALDPLWNSLSAGYTHCGPVGTASALKLVSNLLLITGVASLAEGIAIARGQGIPDDLIKGIFAESPVVSVASAIRLESIMAKDHEGWFSPALARKDVLLAIDLARASGLGVRIGPATEALLSRVDEDDSTKWPDFSAVIEAL